MIKKKNKYQRNRTRNTIKIKKTTEQKLYEDLYLEKIFDQEPQQDAGHRILQVNLRTYNFITKQNQELQKKFSKRKAKYFTYF